jgi:cobalt-precorrin-5B (C1)-methyltransferase
MAALAALAGLPELAACNTVAEAFSRAGDGLGDLIAARARDTAAEILRGTDITLDVAVFDREGRLVGHAPRNLRR